MFQITYETIGVVQMTFLRLLSQEAYQNFTYTCINSAAWFNLKTNNHDMAIKLLGENEIEFSTEGIRPSVLVDGCKVSRVNTTIQWNPMCSARNEACGPTGMISKLHVQFMHLIQRTHKHSENLLHYINGTNK